eukprot:scaffold45353_cov61-Phaeocystis_antarctica.AAC.9
MSAEGAEHHEENRPQMHEGKPPSPSKDQVAAKRWIAEGASGGGGTDGGVGNGGGGSDMEARKTAAVSEDSEFAACKKPYTVANEKAAVEAVASWLGIVAIDDDKGYVASTRTDNNNNTMLMVASENGYPEVVRKLLEDENFVKFELDARAKETRRKPSGFTSARKLAKHAKQGHLYSSAGIRMQESDTAWEG